jgi:hypothetical protein
MATITIRPLLGNEFHRVGRSFPHDGVTLEIVANDVVPNEYLNVVVDANGDPIAGVTLAQSALVGAFELWRTAQRKIHEDAGEITAIDAARCQAEHMLVCT